MATGAPFLRAILLAKALAKLWIAPIGQNGREWRVFPRGRFSAVSPDLGGFLSRAEKLAIFDGYGQTARSMALWEGLSEQDETIGGCFGRLGRTSTCTCRNRTQSRATSRLQMPRDRHVIVIKLHDHHDHGCLISAHGRGGALGTAWGH